VAVRTFAAFGVDTREIAAHDNHNFRQRDLGRCLRKEKDCLYPAWSFPAGSVQLAARKAMSSASLRRIAESLNTRNDNGLQRFNLKQDQGRITLTNERMPHRQALTSDCVDRSLEVVRRRLDETGPGEPSKTRQGSDGFCPDAWCGQSSGNFPSCRTNAKNDLHWAPMQIPAGL